MNKRLYLYCTLLLCIMSCMMLYTVYDAGKALVNGYAEGAHMTDLELKAQQDSVYAKSQEYKDIKGNNWKMKTGLLPHPYRLRLACRLRQQLSLTRKPASQSGSGCVP